jgi:hypothetical protein
MRHAEDQPQLREGITGVGINPFFLEATAALPGYLPAARVDVEITGTINYRSGWRDSVATRFQRRISGQVGQLIFDGKFAAVERPDLVHHADMNGTAGGAACDVGHIGDMHGFCPGFQLYRIGTSRKGQQGQRCGAELSEMRHGFAFLGNGGLNLPGSPGLTDVLD